MPDKISNIPNYKNSFKGRVYFVNKEARKQSEKYRNLIHELKYHTVNKNLSHHIYLDYIGNDKKIGTHFRVYTQYNRYPENLDVYDIHNFSLEVVGEHLQDAVEYVMKNIKKINSWYNQINLTSGYGAFNRAHENNKPAKSTTFKQKIKSFLQKLGKKIKDFNSLKFE